jgi:hypothetical protein
MFSLFFGHGTTQWMQKRPTTHPLWGRFTLLHSSDSVATSARKKGGMRGQFAGRFPLFPAKNSKSAVLLHVFPDACSKTVSSRKGVRIEATRATGISPALPLTQTGPSSPGNDEVIQQFNVQRLSGFA